MTVTPFLVRHVGTDEVLTVLGFTDGLEPRVICAGIRVATFHMSELEVLRAGKDWPRPDMSRDPAVEALYGSLVDVTFGNFDTGRRVRS